MLRPAAAAPVVPPAAAEKGYRSAPRPGEPSAEAAPIPVPSRALGLPNGTVLARGGDPTARSRPAPPFVPPSPPPSPASPASAPPQDLGLPQGVGPVGGEGGGEAEAKAAWLAKQAAPATGAQTAPPRGAPPQNGPPQMAPPRGAPPQQGAPPRGAPPQASPSQEAPPWGTELVAMAETCNEGVDAACTALGQQDEVKPSGSHPNPTPNPSPDPSPKPRPEPEPEPGPGQARVAREAGRGATECQGPGRAGAGGGDPRRGGAKPRRSALADLDAAAAASRRRGACHLGTAAPRGRPATCAALARNGGQRKARVAQEAGRRVRRHGHLKACAAAACASPPESCGGAAAGPAAAGPAAAGPAAAGPAAAPAAPAAPADRPAATGCCPCRCGRTFGGGGRRRGRQRCGSASVGRRAARPGNGLQPGTTTLTLTLTGYYNPNPNPNPNPATRASGTRVTRYSGRTRRSSSGWRRATWCSRSLTLTHYPNPLP